jgi:hypothetical protein
VPFISVFKDIKGGAEGIMNYIKINYKHNMIKLIVLRTLDLRRGWYDNREICQLTGLKFTTIHTHTGYWAETMLNKEGRPVHLLKRIPAVHGRHLTWRYSLAWAGKKWLTGVDPAILKDVSARLASRWYSRIISYDTGEEPLKALTSLKPSLPLDLITLQHSESVYLKCDDGTIIRFASSSYQGHSVQRIPYGAKWTIKPEVVFNALTELLCKENIPMCEPFIKAGLQCWDIEPEIITPNNNELIPDVKNNAAPVPETNEERRAREEDYRAAARARRHY